MIQLGWRPNGGPGGAPSSPTDLRAEALSRRRVRLEWTDASDDESAFVVEMRRGQSAFEVARVTSADVTGIEIGGLRPDRRYVFRVKARNGAGDSRYSNRAVVRTPS